MKPNETKPETETTPTPESIHTEIETKEQGFIKTTIKRDYFLDPATGAVTLTVTTKTENGYLNARQRKDIKVTEETVPRMLVPAEVREKVKALMETKKNI
jgi:hypothetical protein